MVALNNKNAEEDWKEGERAETSEDGLHAEHAEADPRHPVQEESAPCSEGDQAIRTKGDEN